MKKIPKEGSVESIDLAKWPRRKHFEYFDQASDPYIEMTAQLDITPFPGYVKEHGYKFFPALLYGLLKGVNETGEFKYRVLDEGVVKYDRIGASITVPIEGDLFAFCQVEYKENFQEFLQEVAAKQEEAKRQTELVGNERFDVVWVSCAPWGAFTSVRVPTADRRMRSIPVITVGKYYASEGKTLLPVALKVTHALIDGFHIGKLFTHFENSFKAPEKIFQ